MTRRKYIYMRHLLRLFVLPAFCTACLLAIPAIGRPQAQPSLPQRIRPLLDACNVNWDTPGPTSAESMPIGNGDIGLNVWVAPDGDLLFYIGKTDSWGADVRGSEGLMKVGGIRVSFDPKPQVTAAPFLQSLRLHEGEILIREGRDLQLRVWVDANHPVIRVEAHSSHPIAEKVTLYDWRLGKGGDTLCRNGTNNITWYHRDSDHADRHVAGLTFGGTIKGKGFVRAGDTLLQSAAATYRLVSIYPLTAQTTIRQWQDRLNRQVAAIDHLDLDATRQAHYSWWDRFWQRSWIFVRDNTRGDSSALHSAADRQADSVTRGYVLQRFITACAGRGAYPIKFNGSIFVVDNPALKQENSSSKPPMPVTADFRTWGGQYWFQNTRPMYWPLLMEGDFDEMMPLFRMYARIIRDNAVQIDTFYHHTGAYFAETAPFWGGLRYWGPEVKEDWTGHYFTPVLELSMMMLDYYAYTGDRLFARDYLVPVAAAGLTFFDRHFGRDDQRKLLLDPDNSIEMFWKVHNPAPDIAGLRAIIPRMLALPPDLTTQQQRTSWRQLWQELPELPKGTRNGWDVLLPYTGEQNARPRNLENPELYAVYPFRLYGLEKPDLPLAVNTFNTRKFQGKGCWVQDPVQAAMLGMPDIARTYVSYNLTRQDPRLKFPAFWAQGHDYVPDEDNGGNGENGLQQMLMQTDGKKILLLPAWPAGWDAEFRLHAPYRTTVTGRVVGGRLVDLVVTPVARRADVIDMSAGHDAAGAGNPTASDNPPAASDTPRLTAFVDPYIGSGGHGHVFVGASVPFGAVQLGPENFYKGWDWCSGYHYGDSILIGFAHTHLSGTGIGDLGDVLIMPYTGPVKTDKGKETIPGSGYASHYSHANEVVRPGYYAVRLDNYNIRVELTATERVGFHRYYFPEGQPGHVIIDLKEGVNDHATDTYIEQVNDSTFFGRRYSSGWAKNQWLYFAIRTSSPVHRFDIYEGDSLIAGKSGKGVAIKGLISWDQAPALFQLKVGLSPVSPENALANIDAEMPDWDFEVIARQADDKWQQELSRIRIETKSKTDKRIFYTALYHTMIDPMLFNDHNGDYRGADKQVYAHAPFQNYTVFSLWDTYRALNPLYTLIQPDRVDDIIHSLLAIDQQQGKLPVWHLEGCETNTMPGLSSVQVVAEAYLKGFRGFDPQQAFDAMNNSMMKKDRGLAYDQQDQYIPSDKAHESVAMGLEYAVSNASIALVAKQLGKKSDYDYYDRRFHNYTQYYDPVTGFFRGKKADGTWNEPFDPARSSRPWINDLSEGNHWQYLWLVPEDVEGLIHLVGGEQRFIKRLDSLFTIPVLPDPNAPPDIAGLIGQYAHGDEPGHQTIYLYAYAGQQWKSAEKARFIMKNMYPDNIDGLSGNEDCGQMSAWYIFSALGFYPVFPANGGYVLGSPLFDKATIALPDGKSFRIVAVNNSAENKYIQRAEWNGKKYDKSYILHRDILAGGTLTLYMGKTPNQFGSGPGNRPRSVYPDAPVPGTSIK
jgi:predicted alpha-1,2-mannosidase